MKQNPNQREEANRFTPRYVIMLENHKAIYQVLGPELEDAAAARLLVLVAEQFDVRDVANLGPEEILEKRIVK